MPETIRLYELVYIIAPDRSEEQVKAVIDKYSNLITSQGGVVDKTDVWDRRRLAYEIGGYNEGVYVVTVFHAVPSVEAELKRVFRISEDTLRSIIVRPGEEAALLEPTPMPAPRAEAMPRPERSAEPIEESGTQGAEDISEPEAHIEDQVEVTA